MALIDTLSVTRTIRMNVNSLNKLVNALCSTNLQILKKSKHIFLISHMRSRSSLLSHIIGSHNQIMGHSELHLSYTTNIDFLKCKTIILANQNQAYHNEQIYFDKILHNHLKLSLEQFNKRQCKLIFMVREPISSVKSIAMMLSKNPSLGQIEKSANYYVNRLKKIQKIYAEFPKESCYYLSSENLVNNPEEELSNLSDWLELSTYLSNEYTIFDNTGNRRSGDFSDNIKQGKVLKTTTPHKLDLPSNIKSTIETSYQEFIKNNSFMVNNSY